MVLMVKWWWLGVDGEVIVTGCWWCSECDWVLMVSWWWQGVDGEVKVPGCWWWGEGTRNVDSEVIVPRCWWWGEGTRDVDSEVIVPGCWRWSDGDRMLMVRWMLGWYNIRLKAVMILTVKSIPGHSYSHSYHYNDECISYFVYLNSCPNFLSTQTYYHKLFCNSKSNYLSVSPLVPKLPLILTLVERYITYNMLISNTESTAPVYLTA